MTRPRHLVTLLTLSILLLAAANAHAARARLILDSEPGDVIGWGQHWDYEYTPETSQFFSLIVGDYVGDRPGWVYFNMGDIVSGAITWATLTFETETLDLALQPGFYPDARRAGFAPPGHPGLAVSFRGYGPNEVFGEFTIDYVTFVPAPGGVFTIETFGVHFVQRADHPEAPALRGVFTYDGRAVPEPDVAPLALAALAFARLRRPPAQPWTPPSP